MRSHGLAELGRFGQKSGRGVYRKLGKEIQKIIKDSGLKVQAQIQGDQLRVTGKKKDDLQACIALLRSQKELEQPLQYENFRD